jgi:hypothetical protein
MTLPLSWNEIQNRAAAFAKEWAGTHSEDADAERVAFLFGLYERYTSLLA